MTPTIIMSQDIPRHLHGFNPNTLKHNTAIVDTISSCKVIFTNTKIAT